MLRTRAGRPLRRCSLRDARTRAGALVDVGGVEASRRAASSMRNSSMPAGLRDARPAPPRCPSSRASSSGSTPCGHDRPRAPPRPATRHGSRERRASPCGRRRRRRSRGPRRPRSACRSLACSSVNAVPSGATTLSRPRAWSETTSKLPSTSTAELLLADRVARLEEAEEQLALRVDRALGRVDVLRRRVSLGVVLASGSSRSARPLNATTRPCGSITANMRRWRKRS